MMKHKLKHWRAQNSCATVHGLHCEHLLHILGRKQHEMSVTSANVPQNTHSYLIICRESVAEDELRSAEHQQCRVNEHTYDGNENRGFPPRTVSSASRNAKEPISEVLRPKT